jgi:AcrR family transcriptional regulator
MSSADNERERGAGLSGRLGQARRNDASILASARAVFVANPDAPIAAVAEHAGVGIGALYRRYASKEDLLRKICADGLELYISIATDAVEDAGGDPWVVFATFMRGIVEADTPTLATKLAGRFSPTPEMFARAQHADELNQRLVARTQAAGVLRADVNANDLGHIFEQIATVHGATEERTMQLRLRYLTLYLDAIRAPGVTPLPGPQPTASEQHERWQQT